MTYNYFPDEINTNDVMKMRFELADTDVSKDESRSLCGSVD